MAEIYVKVKPGSEKFHIEKNTYPVIHLENPAEKGKANSELVRRLERILGEKVGIISGHQSGRKKIAVDMEKKDIMEKLEAETDG